MTIYDVIYNFILFFFPDDPYLGHDIFAQYLSYIVVSFLIVTFFVVLFRSIKRIFFRTGGRD